MDQPHPSQTEFRHFVAVHRARLVRFVERRIGDRDDAEDLVQEALAEAALGLHRFRGASSLSTWVHGIALNLVRQHLARSPARRFRFDDDEDAIAGLACEMPGPDRRHELMQSLRRVEREVGRMPPTWRDALWAVSIDELGFSDAASRLGVSACAVRDRVARARARLQERVGARG